MKHHRLLSVFALMLGCVACASSDPVRKDRFNQQETDGTAGGGGESGFSTSDATGSGAGASGPSATSGAGASTQSSSSGQPPACVDDGPEGNDSEASATDLGTIDDCDASGGAFSGVLAGDDVDWFVYHGTDATGCVVDPARSLDADGEYRVCQFFTCDDGGPLTLTCPDGAWDETSPEGRPGCCSHEALQLSPDCSSWTDNSAVYVRLDKPPAAECVHYTLSFHY